MRRFPLAAALLLLVLAVLLPGRALVEVLRPGMGNDPALRGGALLLKALLGFHGALLLVIERLRARLPRAGAWAPLLERGLCRPGPVRTGEAIALSALLLLATALRFQALDQGLWFDEIDTLVTYVRRPFALILTTFDSQNQHQLYSLLARLAFVAFGESAWALRLPAVLLGVISLYAVWRLGRLVAPRRETFFAVGFLTVSYHHVWFSQNARGYTGLLLFGVLGSEALLRMLASHDPRRTRLAWGYGAAMALAVWMHATAVLLVAGHGLVWLALLVGARGRAVGPNRWLPALGFLLAVSLSLTVYALVLDPFLATLTAPTMPGLAVEWKSPLWLVRETLTGLARAAPGGPVAGLAFLALGVAVGALGLASYARQGRAVLGVFLAGAVVTALALAATRHNLWPRFFFSSAGFFVLILGRGLCEWVRLFARAPPLADWSNGLQRAVLVLLCLASAATLPRAWGPKQDFEGALAWLDERVRIDDVVVTAGMGSLPLRELYARTWPRADNPEELQAIERSHARTWLVYCTPVHLRGVHPRLWQHLEASYERAAVFPGTVGGSEVVVMLRRQ